MKQYIDKDALVAEIERQKDGYLKHSRDKFCAEWSCGTLDNILSFLETLEVKEVDLDDKNEWKNTGGFGSTWDPDSPDYCPD